MQEKIKEVISVFLKIPKEVIIGSTIIDRSAVSSSILLHRMYAKLNAEGIVVNNYQQVKSFDDLLASVNKVSSEQTAIVKESIATNNERMALAPPTFAQQQSIGIDIEAISAMPVTDDFREHTFYCMNYSPAEIAYCILQPNPYASFAGLFAAKEAIVKANNEYKKTEFKNIPIQHLANNKPVHSAFSISISHTNDMAVAVAIPVQPAVNNALAIENKQEIEVNSNSLAQWIFIFIATLLSLVSLFLIIKK